MLFMSGDDATIGPVCANSLPAASVAEDWQEKREDIKKLTAEAEELLAAIDLAISSKDFGEDKEGRQMQISWAFLGPGLSRRIEIVKLTSTIRPSYTQLAEVIMALNLRRQTLELNGIKVFKKA